MLEQNIQTVLDYYEAAERRPRVWFTRSANYDGPPIMLECGRHTKSGRFIPKNIKLTSIARLNKFEWMTRGWQGVYRPLPMVGDNKKSIAEIYAANIAAKKFAAQQQP